MFNKGPLAAVKLLKSRIDEGYMSAGAFVSILTYLNGVNAGYTSNINGLAEALNDGSTASWDGNTYTTYGGLTRATYSPSLNSTPTAVSGSIQYDTVDQQYMNAFYGSGQYEPNLIVTTPIGFSYLKSKFQTQQRFQDTRLEVGVGFRGLSFNGATVVASRYCPGSYLTGPAGVGTADPVATTVLSEMSSPGGGAPSVTAYPVGSLGNSGESLWILNARKPFLNYYVSNDPTFGPVCPKRALSAATVRSQTMCKTCPPPIAYPATIAITGFGIERILRCRSSTFRRGTPSAPT